MHQSRRPYSKDLVSSRFESVGLSDDEEEESSAESYASLKGLVEGLHRQVQQNQKEIQRLQGLYDRHSGEVLETFDDLEEYVENESMLNSTISKYLVEGRRKKDQQLTDALRRNHQREVDGIKGVLESYKKEIIRQKETQNEKIEQLSSRVAAMEAKPCEWSEHKVRTIVMEEVRQGLNSLEEKLTHLFRDEINTVANTLSAEFEEASQGEEAITNELFRRMEERLVESENTLTEQVMENVSLLRSEMESHTATTEAPIKEVQRCLEEMGAALDKVQQTQKEADKPKKDTVRPTVAVLEQDVEALKDQLAKQKKELENVRNQHPLENAFHEVKDWVGDLDKRSVSRGEIIEIVSELRDAIATLREEVTSV